MSVHDDAGGTGRERPAPLLIGGNPSWRAVGHRRGEWAKGHRRGDQGRPSTAGGNEAGRPPQGSWQPPCRYTRPLSRPLHSRIPAPRPLSCAGRPPSSLIPCRAWPPLLYSPLRRPFTHSIPPCAGPQPSSSGPYSPL